MAHPDSGKWDARYQAGKHDQKQAVRVLRDYAHLLPASGDALDLACGTGANALYLAEKGVRVSAWDISAQALAILESRCNRKSLQIDMQIRDVVQSPPLKNSFDVIVVSYFLERGLMPEIINALRPGGLLFYQTFTRAQVEDCGPGNPDYRLAQNELLDLCRDLQLLIYHEENCVGDCSQGFRNEAYLVGRRKTDS